MTAQLKRKSTIYSLVAVTYFQYNFASFDIIQVKLTFKLNNTTLYKTTLLKGYIFIFV